MTRTLLLVALLTACGPRNGAQPESPPTPAPPAETPKATPEATPEATPTPAASGKADGETCLAASDCASGICEGMGCAEDTPGTCKNPARMCSMDLQSYCGCDGETFQASGSCPGRRFESKGACK